jgi:hypothetical protein
MRLELAYIAAFLDCDGSFTIYRRKREVGGFNYSAKINFYSQNLSVLYELKEVVGGEVGPPNEGLDVYTLQLPANPAVAAAKLLLPYLRIKREQALLMIEFQKVVNATPKLRNRSGKGGMARLPESVIEQRRQFYLRMQELNDRDPQAFRTNRANSVKTPVGATPSQAVVGEGTTEGVTTREMSPNNNSLQEGATGNGKHSLGSTVDGPVH